MICIYNVNQSGPTYFLFIRVFFLYLSYLDNNNRVHEEKKTLVNKQINAFSEVENVELSYLVFENLLILSYAQ